MKPIISGYRYETHSEEIRRAATKKLIYVGESFMNELDLPGRNHRVLRDLKTELELEMLTFLASANSIPIGPASIVFEARIEQRAVSDKILFATKGKRIAIPENQFFVLWESMKTDFELPLTESERNFHDD